MIAAGRYALADAIRSQRILPPLVAFGSVLGILYAVRPNPILSSYGATALLMLPLAAWCTGALLSSEDPVQRDVTAANAGGHGHAARARLTAAAAMVCVLAVAAVVLPWVIGAVLVPQAYGKPLASRIVGFLPFLGIGLLAHLVVALPGVGIAALWSSPVVRRPATTLAGIATSVVLAVPLDGLRGVPVAGVLPRAVPPLHVARVMTDGTALSTVLSGLVPSMVGAALFTGIAAGAYVALARRRA